MRFSAGPDKSDASRRRPTPPVVLTTYAGLTSTRSAFDTNVSFGGNVPRCDGRERTTSGQGAEKEDLTSEDVALLARATSTDD
jgi:hypothetical protein